MLPTLMPAYPNYTADERFKPRHPIDPFGDADGGRKRSRQPWALDADTLPPLSLSKLQRSVILAIGGTRTVLPYVSSTHSDLF